MSSSNSLIGSSTADEVGLGGVTALTNGNYVVASPYWSGNEGAVTWESGTAAAVGTVSTGNSLVGTAAGDEIGFGGVTALTNGNYVVASFVWHGEKGAVTWGSGTTGIVGAVSTSNSIVGGVDGYEVGYFGPGESSVTALPDGNFVIASPNWNYNAGAVTWGSGTTGIDGVVSSSNSLIGEVTNEEVGLKGVIVLADGNYVVVTPAWESDRGAVTWGSATSGVDGGIYYGNSLIGYDANDQVGAGGVTVLSNGSYVVSSPYWNGNTGAVTWGSGTAGVSGQISSSNSLVGAAAGAELGTVTALTDGNYVVSGGGTTWASGITGVTGAVPLSNTVTGSGTVTALADGNYLVTDPTWGNGDGAVTWFNGSTGLALDGTTVVGAQNSLVGPSPFVTFGTPVADPAIDGVVAPFSPPQGGGTVSGGLVIGLLDPNQITYGLDQGNNPPTTITVTPGFLTRTLDSGTAVVLQASNDITVNSPIVASAGGKGGALTLSAGNSVLINASITTDNGNLTLTANDTAADGVVAADRAAGAAVITVASGTTLNLGTGTLTLDMASGAGITTTAPGAITLTGVTVKAGSIVSSTVTTLTDNGPNPSAVGQGVSLTVAVAPSYGTATLNGATVKIEDASNKNAVVATPTLSNGTASFSLTGLPFGTHSLFAAYAGATGLLASQSVAVSQAVEYGTTTTLTANGPNPSPLGTSASFTVTVTPSGGSPINRRDREDRGREQ